MTPLQAQAMLIRHHVALKNLTATNGLEMLALVVAPTAELLQASMEKATRRSISPLAREIASYEPMPVAHPTGITWLS